MAVSKERIDEYKVIYKSKYGEELTDAEASDQANRLAGFFKILWEVAQEDNKRKRRLKTEPDGFSLDNTYTCGVCRNSIGPLQNWYSKFGITCLPCHKALISEVIPSFVAFQRESFFLDWQLKSDFNIHPATVRKYVRTGVLKALIIPTESGAPYEYIFLRKDNPGLISRHTPEWKSHKRNRDKVSRKQSKERAQKMRKEFETKRQKWIKKRKNLD